MISKDLIEYVFCKHDDAGLIDVLQELLIQNGDSFVFGIAEALDNSLEARIEQAPELLNNWVNSLSNMPNRLPRFLYARFLIRQGNDNEAVELLDSVIQSSPHAEPFLLLQAVRSLVRLSRFSDAANYLKLALSFDPAYSFFVKCEKMLRKILASGDWKPRRSLRIALLGSSTTTFLASVLQATCFKNGIYAEIYEGGYGNYRQDILSPESALYTFNPQAVIIILNHRDLGLTPVSQMATGRHIADNLRELWTILQERNPCHLIHCGFDLPLYGSWGCLEDTLTGGRARVVNKINAFLAENLPAGVSFCDINRVALRLGDRFHSDIGWYSSRQYPSLESLPILADHLGAHLRAAFGYSAKVLVLDLDNTLWGGVIGEDGLSGIILGPPSPEGECYLDLHRYIKELKDRGVLLAVCSKNNLVDAELPFKEHDSTILRLDDFVVFTANWQDKATNIQEMAQRLSLGLDSFVFLDDNPLERSWVRSCLPDVIVPECGNKPWEMLDSLRCGKYFEVVAVTKEDAERHKNYKSNLARQEFEKSFTTVENFLASLDMVAENGPIDEPTLTRSTQLINKTNQFNLTTRRYTEEQVRCIAESPEWWTRWFKMKDKFGDHGLIGIILAKIKGGSWSVDTWLMSCRVLGRKMEEFMFEELLKAAHEHGASIVHGEYVPSAKNELVKHLYIDLGCERKDETDLFTFQLTNNNVPHCEFIRPA